MTGTGTELDPYIILTPSDLDDVRLDLDEGVFYQLGADIDLSGYDSWVPIGDNHTAVFEGRLNGNGFKISNLTITSSVHTAFGGSVGLFGMIGISFFTTYTSSYSVKDLTLENVNINLNNWEIGNYFDDSGRSLYVGALAGSWRDTTFPDTKEKWNAIKNVKVISCSISINKSNLGASVSESVSSVYVAGLIGSAQYGLITSCSVDNVTISGIVSSSSPDTSFISGLTNDVNQATYNCVKNSYINFEYKINGPSYSTHYNNLSIAGFGHSNAHVEIYDNYVYNTAVSGALKVNGYMDAVWVSETGLGDDGHDFPSGRIYIQTTFGNTPESSVYLFTRQYDEFEDSSSLYNYVQSGSNVYTTNPVTPGTMPTVVELTETQMKDSASYVNWDFENVWTQSNDIQNGYPFFIWENLTGSLPPPLNPEFIIIMPNGGEEYMFGELIPVSWSFSQ